MEVKVTDLEAFSLRLTELLTEIDDLLVRKRKDYGNSYEKIRAKYGETVPLIRLNDKFARLDKLISEKKEPSNEPIDDTFKDIIGYCILELMYRKLEAEFRKGNLVKCI